MVSVRVLGLEVVIWPTAKSMLEQGKDRAVDGQYVCSFMDDIMLEPKTTIKFDLVLCLSLS